MKAKSWVPIMASLRANLKEIKRPTILYIATRRMNWPPRSNWNLLFIQQTSVSLPNSCDIIDSNINDGSAHNWAWPALKIFTWDKAVDVIEKFTVLICQRDRQWDQRLVSTWLHWTSLWDLVKYFTAGLISPAAYSAAWKLIQMSAFRLNVFLGYTWTKCKVPLHIHRNF